MAIYYSLGSSMGGCGVPDNRHEVKDPTNNRYYNQGFSNASGNNATGRYYSPVDNRGGRVMCINGEWARF